MTEHEARTGDKTMHDEAERPALVGGEDGLRDALRAYLKAQRRMLDKWGDGDANVRGDLWRDLHACEDAAEAALSLPAAQDGDWPDGATVERAFACMRGYDCFFAFPDEVLRSCIAVWLKAAAAPTPEPYAWVYEFNDPDPQCDMAFGAECPEGWRGKPGVFPLYTTPNAIRGDKGAEAVTDGGVKVPRCAACNDTGCDSEHFLCQDCGKPE